MILIGHLDRKNAIFEILIEIRMGLSSNAKIDLSDFVNIGSHHVEL
jgi:hypothetical protein